jgi:hypothetical protein
MKYTCVIGFRNRLVKHTIAVGKEHFNKDNKGSSVTSKKNMATV